jgi:hypothetical protein
MVNKKEFIIISCGGVVYYVNADGSNQVLIDAREQRIAAGIIYYNAEKRILYITTDEQNVVYAYHLK